MNIFIAVFSFRIRFDTKLDFYRICAVYLHNVHLTFLSDSEYTVLSVHNIIISYLF